MTIDVVRNALLLCAVINYGILILWVLLLTLAHDWFYRLNARLFRVSVGQFDGINFALIALYKVGIILFYIVPYVALRIVA